MRSDYKLHQNCSTEMMGMIEPHAITAHSKVELTNDIRRECTRFDGIHIGN